MKKTKIVLVMLAALALVLPMSVSAAGDEEASGQPMEITWMGDSPEKTWWHGQLEEMFNVKITTNGVGFADGEAQEIMVASGEIPDTFNIGGYAKTHELYEDGVIRSVPEKMFRQYAPNYSSGMDRNFPLVWDVYRAPDKPDHQLAIGSVSPHSMVSVFYFMVRKDYFDRMGVKLPQYEETKQLLQRNIYYYENDVIDLQWVEDLLVAFRDGDPDGNGEIDTIPWGTYGMSTRPYTQWWSGPILGAFDLPVPDTSRNLEVDGKLYLPQVSPRWKEFTKLIARWWEMGLMDPEHFTTDRNTHWDKSRTGVFGMMTSAWNYAGRAPTRVPDTLLTEEDLAAGREVVMFAPKGPYGQFTPMYGTGFLRPRAQMFNVNLSDEKTAKILEIMNSRFRLDDGTEEGIRLWLNWDMSFGGKEGVHWKWAGEPFKSNTVLIPPEERPEGYPKGRYLGGFFDYLPDYRPQPITVTLENPPSYAAFAANHQYSDRVQAQTFATARIDLFNKTEFNDIMAKKGEVLQTMAYEFWSQAVTGEIDIDAEWDGYVKRFMDAGGSELIAEVEKMDRWEDLFR